MESIFIRFSQVYLYQIARDHPLQTLATTNKLRKEARKKFQVSEFQKTRYCYTVFILKGQEYYN